MVRWLRSYLEGLNGLCIYQALYISGFVAFGAVAAGQGLMFDDGYALLLC